ncbi:MAG TPA: TonB C-terminal domain-containing protein [Candidatus Eisenbacteria bacterium]|nr:TonB C-terminal domain-containing protein [Candidatus Eisenbacteria bacterium]
MMIPRILVPVGARLSPEDIASTRRRPTNLDERTLVPSSLPLVPLDGRTTIPANLPLEAIATRMVVPRDINLELVQKEEESALPPQPTEMDERITIPVGVAAPDELPPLPPISGELVEPNIISTGEVSFLPEERDYRGRDARVQTIVSTVVYALMLLSLPFSAKYFNAHVPTPREQEIARQQMTVLLPPGALDSLKPSPPPAPPPIVRVDPRVIRKIAPPAPAPQPPAPTPQPVQPHHDLPSAPMPQPNVASQAPPSPIPSHGVLPKPQVRLENPDMPVPQQGLILPKNGSPGDLIRDAARNTKPNAPIAVGGGGPITSGRGSGGGGRGSASAGIELLTDTQGVDFNDYLRRIYYIVKNNWYAVMPPSVSLGDQGVVSLQFRIMRDGSVPDGMPVQVFGSGKEPLDRAAYSSIRASNPFPPLPSQFTGPYIELRYTYYYNMQPPSQ